MEDYDKHCGGDDGRTRLYGSKERIRGGTKERPWTSDQYRVYGLPTKFCISLVQEK